MLFVYFGKKTNNEMENGISIALDKESLNKNESLSFSVNLRSSKPCMDLAAYEIFDLSNVSVVLAKQEVMELNSNLPKKITLNLKNLNAGSYILRLRARCNGNTKLSTAKFRIISEAKPLHAEQKELVDLNSSSESRKTQIPSESRDNENFLDMKTSEIYELAKKDQFKAEKICDSLSTDIKDRCFSSLADATNNFQYCSRVQSLSSKDGCYINFALRGNFDVCGNIYDTYQKEGCYALKSAAKIENAE
ncbi:hypothetical protein HYY71_07215 [Candidatus Woesearchaeota archaeon]|nr:hypothetical protein [Candidatus Woesearchaeota archaeon]